MKKMIMSNAAFANEEVAAAIAEVCEENERIFVDGNDCICLYEDEYGASEEEVADETAEGWKDFAIYDELLYVDQDAEEYEGFNEAALEEEFEDEEFDDEDLPDGFAPDFDEPFYVLFEEEEEYGSKQDKIA